MKRIDLAGVCVAAVAATGVMAASASYAAAPNWGPLLVSPIPASRVGASASANSLLAREIGVLTAQGISPARAEQAIGVQGVIANTGLVGAVESAMGSRFAGVWFEAAAARLHIGVTSAASRRVAEGVVRRAGLSAHVVETPVRSTWAQLMAAQNRWSSRLGSRQGGAETALLPQSNAVSVRLSASVSASERAAIAREAARAAVNVLVSFVPGSQRRPTPDAQTSCDKFASDKSNCNKTITSGVGIEGEAKSLCTAGPLAILKGSSKSETYLLTSGHCATKKGETWSAFDRSGKKTTLGKVVDLVYSLAGDYSDILIENEAWKHTGKVPVLAVTAEWNTTEEKSFPVKGERKPTVGNTNCHEGISTGHSCGLIEALNVEVTFLEIGTERFTSVKGLVEDKGALREGGDSGGPWLFIETSKEVLMEGIHSGGSGTISYYEPLGTALGSLKLELLTTANEVRP
ncbi:MAG TPA: hypothetical protein VFY36_03080 [Solirubrobacteraceae bacterium]|nr:hypothetical protein [Solirubrobacteraceae bacterium]